MKQDKNFYIKLRAKGQRKKYGVRTQVKSMSLMTKESKRTVNGQFNVRSLSVFNIAINED